MQRVRRPRTRTAARRSRGGRTRAATAGPGRGRSRARSTGRRRSRARMCGTPKRSRRTSTGASRPRSRSRPRGLRQRPPEELVPEPQATAPDAARRRRAPGSSQRSSERTAAIGPDSFRGKRPASAAAQAAARGLRCAPPTQLPGRFEHRGAGVLGLEHGRVAGLAQDLAHQPVGARERQLDDQRAVRRAPRRSTRRSRSQRARSGEIQTRATREAGTAPVRGQPSRSAVGSTSARGSKVFFGDPRLLDAVEPEVARVLAARGRS